MITDLYYGPKYEYDTEYITDLANYYNATRIFALHMKMQLT